MKKLAPVLVLTSSILWGSMGIVTRYVASFGFTTAQTAAVRICSAAVVLVLLVLFTDKGKFKIQAGDVKWLLGTGIGSLFINNLTYAEMVQRAPLSVAVVLLYTAPFFVMVLSVLFFREKLTFRKVFALLLSFAGCILVVGLTGAQARSVGGETILIGLCAGFGYSLYSIFGKVLVGKYESLTVTVYTFLIAAAATLLISRPAEMAEKVMGNLSAFPVIFLGSFVTVGLPYLIYSVALKHIESSRASIIASFEVVAASLFGVVLYGETLSGMNLTGILLVVTALTMLQLPAKTKYTDSENLQK